MQITFFFDGEASGGGGAKALGGGEEREQRLAALSMSKLLTAACRSITILHAQITMSRRRKTCQRLRGENVYCLTRANCRRAEKYEGIG